MGDTFESAMFESPRADFILSQRDLGLCGRWRYLHRVETDNFVVSIGIWHKSIPLRKFRNTSTSAIIDMIQDNLERWLNPHSRQPVFMRKAWSTDDAGTLLNANITHSGGENALRTLQTTFQCILAAGRKFDALSANRRKPVASHNPPILWTDDGDNRDYPEPDLNSIYTNSAHRRAALLILRHPTMYDEDSGFLLERYIWSSLSSLFSELNASFMSHTKSDLLLSARHHPCIVLYESKEFTECVRDAMAQAIYPALKDLLRLHGDHKTLPCHCFLYGIHLSPTYLTLCAHFPTRQTHKTTGITTWHFRQVVVTKYLIRTDPYYENSHEELLHSRWRLLVLLFTVLKHTQLLSTELERLSNENKIVNLTSETLSSSVLRPRQLPETLKRLYRVWNRNRLSIPKDWMTPSDDEELDFHSRNSLYEQDPARNLLHKLTSTVMNQLRQHLVLASSDTLLRNHLTKHYHGPDFLLSRQLIRSDFWDHAEEILRDPSINTYAHMYRTYDFIQLSTAGWHDFNIIVARLFSGFAGYAVQWTPTIRYPFSVASQVDASCVVDFALAVCAVPATNSITIERSRYLPLTLSSPAVLIGCHSTRRDSEGCLILQDEMKILTEIMRPHIQVFSSHADYKPYIPDSLTVESRPYLFCTYVKPGFLHILAFRRAGQSEITAYLVDSLPLALDCENHEDMKNRLRAAMALFTLQNEVVKISEAWGSICWPVDMLADEHEAIIEVTGVCSPTPTESLPDEEQGCRNQLYINAPGTCIEDEPEFIAKQVVKSVERVTPWLAQLDCSVPPGDGSLEPWD